MPRAYDDGVVILAAWSGVLEEVFSCSECAECQAARTDESQIQHGFASFAKERRWLKAKSMLSARY